MGNRLRTILFRLVLCVSFFISSSLAASVDSPEGLPHIDSYDGWSLRIDDNGVKIYTREIPNSSFVAVKTEQVIQSGLSNIVANYLAVESFPEWVKDLQTAHVVRGYNAQQERIIYMRMDMPWPLKDRDSVMGQRVKQDESSLIVQIREWNQAELLPERKGVIRVPKVDSELVLIPLSEDSTKMIWQGHNEPGGLIPSFLANWLIDNVFYESSLNMRVRFESAEFIKQAPSIVDFHSK